MKFDKKSLLLYAVTDRTWLKEESLFSRVEKSLRGGVTFLQLREKNLSEEKFLEEAISIKALAAKYRVPFVINDNIEIAVKSNADGVHIGQHDEKIEKARSALGSDKIIGVSVQTVNQALDAQRRGADYLGVGAVFTTSTKPDADSVSFETLKDICSAVNIPVIAIGGINRHNINMLEGSGITGVAVVSAIFAESNAEDAARNLLSLAQKSFSMQN